MSTPGVQSAEDLVVSFINWRRLGQSSGSDKTGCSSETGTCGTASALLIGFDTATNKTLPWDIVQGSLADLSTPNAVAVDSSYFKELAVERIGDRAEINEMQVTVRVVTQGIRSFTTLPFIFANLPLARTLVDASVGQATYTLVQVAPGSRSRASPQVAAGALAGHRGAHPREFRQRSLDYWLFETGAGSGLIAGAVLAIVVGIVVVAQTLYASTKEHINEFATLRALGASSGFIRKVILWQAVLSAIMGYCLGMVLAQVVIYFLRDILPIVMTFNLVWGLLVLTIAMCVLAAVSAIFKVIRIDPAVVFSR